MTVEVGSKWVAKTDEPWGSGVFMGDEVVIDSILHNDVEFVEEDGFTWWGRLDQWQNHMEPVYTPKAINTLSEKAEVSIPSRSILGDHDGTLPDDLTKESSTKDNVNNPAHYGQGKIEAIEYIEDFLTEEEYQGYLRGNIAKYLHRFKYKNGIEDLKKAQWYLNRLIGQQEKDKDP